MHELSITQSIVDTVRERGGRTAGAQRPRAGRQADRGGAAESMLFCFDLIVEGTELRRRPPGHRAARGARALPDRCGTDFALPDLDSAVPVRQRRRQA